MVMIAKAKDKQKSKVKKKNGKFFLSPINIINVNLKWRNIIYCPK
jgi:hypothetical protein